jgi:hypothetical protein
MNNAELTPRRGEVIHPSGNWSVIQGRRWWKLVRIDAGAVRQVVGFVDPGSVHEHGMWMNAAGWHEPALTWMPQTERQVWADRFPHLAAATRWPAGIPAAEGAERAANVAHRRATGRFRPVSRKALDAFAGSQGEAERAVRAFAEQFPTPNVLAAVAHCESGRLSWDAVGDLFIRSLGTALDQVR